MVADEYDRVCLSGLRSIVSVLFVVFVSVPERRGFDNAFVTSKTGAGEGWVAHRAVPSNAEQ